MSQALLSFARAVLAAVALALVVTGCDREDERAGDTTATAAATTPAAPNQHASSASHDAHAQHGQAPVLAEGKRWATDEPLRAAMTRIREAVERNAPAYGQQQLQATDAEALATAVEQDIAYMVANCALEPEPDAALHALIGRMMNAAAALRTNPGSEAGLPQLVAVLQEYSTTFDHPGWAVMDQGLCPGSACAAE